MPVTALLVTREVFGDVLEIQRHERTRVYDLYYQKAVPIVPRYLVLEVDERIAADGIDRSAAGRTPAEILDDLGRLIEEERVESLTVVLLNSYRNSGARGRPWGEAVRARFPELPVTLSVEVLPQFREYERASTTVMSGYLKPVIQRYMDTLQQGPGPGVSFDWRPAYHAEQRRHLSRGRRPAAGRQCHPVGTRRGRRRRRPAWPGRPEYRNLITLDMGGTSTDVCLVHDGEPRVTVDSRIDGLPIVVPMVEIITVGAGGGSVAYRDPGGLLKVGPGKRRCRPGAELLRQGRGPSRPLRMQTCSADSFAPHSSSVETCGCAPTWQPPRWRGLPDRTGNGNRRSRRGNHPGRQFQHDGCDPSGVARTRP